MELRATIGILMTSLACKTYYYILAVLEGERMIRDL